MAGVFTFPIGRTSYAGTDAAESAVEELKGELVKQKTYGTAAPSSSTSGTIYFQLGASSSDPVKVFVKVDGTWYGG